uniref:Uncharacterized protein n=1 Tax=Hucho hucho TaxID=62062 RepID=A0A4W5K8G9_9TELE
MSSCVSVLLCLGPLSSGVSFLLCLSSVVLCLCPLLCLSSCVCPHVSLSPVLLCLCPLSSVLGPLVSLSSCVSVLLCLCPLVSLSSCVSVLCLLSSVLFCLCPLVSLSSVLLCLSCVLLCLCPLVSLSSCVSVLLCLSLSLSLGQMVVAKVLSRHYADVLLYGQSILYYEHCVSVSRDLKDKRLEGEYLEILSSLYLSLNTEKSSRKSLDYSKQSLRISIDLGKREEESETWLQVGRIYYLIHEDQLADMYLQVSPEREGDERGERKTERERERGHIYYLIHIDEFADRTPHRGRRGGREDKKNRQRREKKGSRLVSLLCAPA